MNIKAKCYYNKLNIKIRFKINSRIIVKYVYSYTNEGVELVDLNNYVNSYEVGNSFQTKKELDSDSIL